MIENRKSYRLPFRGKFIFGNEERVTTGNTTNLSAGGAFVMTMEPLPRNTRCKCLFILEPEAQPVITHAIVKRLVASSPNVDETPGMGLEFVQTSNEEIKRISDYMLDTRKNFELAATLLASGEPELASLEPLLENMHLPPVTDLGDLRFFVERILKSIELIDLSQQ